MATGHSHINDISAGLNPPEIPITGHSAMPNNGNVPDDKKEQLKRCLHEWFGITKEAPNYYEYLGINNFETNSTVIDNAADRRMKYLRDFQSGQNGDICTELLNKISKIRRILLRSEKKQQYDASLQPVNHKRNDIAERVQETVPRGIPVAPTSKKIAPQPPITTESIQSRRVENQRAGLSDQLADFFKKNKTVSAIAGAASATALMAAGIISGSSNKKNIDSPHPSHKTEETQVAGVDIENTTQVAGVDIENTTQVAGVDIENTTHVRRPRVTDPTPPLENATPNPVEQHPTEEPSQPEISTPSNPLHSGPGHVSLSPAPKIDEEAAERRRSEEEQRAADIARGTFREGVESQHLRFQENPAYTAANTANVLDAARTEEDATTRAALAFLAVDKAIQEGDLEAMNDALDVAKNADPHTRYQGMHEHDVLTQFDHSLQSNNRMQFDTQERIDLAYQLIEQTWTACEYEDYMLADELVSRASELMHRLSASHISNWEERSTFANYINKARRRIAATKNLVAEFSALATSARNGDVGAEAMLNIKQDGDWKSAIPQLAQSDNPAVQRAAELDSNLSDNSDASEILAAAEAWIAAAVADPNNKDFWNGRANAHLQHAISKGEILRGSARLEFNALSTRLGATLQRNGIDDENQIGMQGHVEGRPGGNEGGAEGEEVVEVEELEERVVSLMGAKTSDNDLGYLPVSTSIPTRNREGGSTALNPPELNNRQVENFYLIHPNDELEIDRHVRLSIELPTDSRVFEAVYMLNNERSRGVDIRAYVQMENGSIIDLANINRNNFGAGGGEERISTNLPRNARAIIFVIGRGTGPNQSAGQDHFFLAEPAIRK